MAATTDEAELLTELDEDVLLLCDMAPMPMLSLLDCEAPLFL